ncbi:MAG: hypothetical protein JXB14_00880 [Candidatus Altiarchaeota archaeon]|nr:hypothetical protein [Candidatus Altiarchaeota archaeon]
MVIIAILAGLIIAFIWVGTMGPCCTAGIADNTPSMGSDRGSNNQSSVEACDWSPENSCESLDNSSSSVKVEVYHFHGDHQCYSCVLLGQLAEKTVKTYFADEMASGGLVFGHINYDLSENSALADKFGATGSSLWIGTTVGSEFHKEEDTTVWYKLSDEKGYLSYLKGVLDKRLAGDMS